VLLVFFLVGVAVLARTTPLGDELAETARSLAGVADEPWAPFAYVALYALAVTIGLPGTALTLIGGAAFGLWGGLAINLVGAILGAAGAFLLARTIGRSLAERVFGRHLARIGSLEDDRRALRFWLRLRLIPIVPYNATNFAAGITRTRLASFLIGSAVGIVPSTFLFTYFATALVAGGEARSGALVPILLSLAGLGVLSLIPTIVRLLRRRA
jgi:uncharacterized membrane protein YdjX (TVP38/TMEM64 family)